MIVTVRDWRLGLSTSESVASASAMATGPPFSVQLLAKSSPGWPELLSASRSGPGRD